MMKEDQDFYKREEDRKWRERTDERVNALTTSDTVQNDRLDEIDEHFTGIFESLHGDKNAGGMLSSVIDLERRLNELRALMMPDSLGNGGVISRLKRLEKKEEREEKSLEYRWKFWTAFIIALLSLSGILFKEWPEIRQLLPHDDGKTAYQRLTETATPKKKHRRGHHAAPEPAPVEEGAMNDEQNPGN